MAKINGVRRGTYTVVVLDMHKGLHESTQDTLEQVYRWLNDQDPEAGMMITHEEWDRAKILVELHGAVHIVTDYDADILLVKGGAKRG